MFSDPAAAAWVLAGSPDVDAGAPIPGRCGRCGTDGPTVPSSRIISEAFTGFDTWPFGSRRLCVPCAWVYSRAPRAVPAMLIEATTVTEYRHPAALAAILAAGPLPATQAAVVPTLRRRHILPTARWGHLATEGLVIAWNATAASRLADLMTLRPNVTAWVQSRATTPLPPPQLASTTTAVLHRPAPPFPLLASQPRPSWPRFLAAWNAVQPWRTVPPLWNAAHTLTHATTHHNSSPYQDDTSCH
ncbi:hypothetical protein [Mycobacterium servetii]|uniref:Uncharacterized protein n=1 Tax=Mycobacterium servetii TaxID=3237418 RepID=A0ABV4C9L6_9MYCO